VFFALGASVVYFLVMPMLVRFSLGMQQSPGEATAEIALLPKVGEYLSLMMGLIFRVRHRISAAGDPHAPGPRRYRHVRAAQGKRRYFIVGAFRDRGGAHAARRAQSAVARLAA
jgi:sec-independent protein translocase protein TatC